MAENADILEVTKEELHKKVVIMDKRKSQPVEVVHPDPIIL